MMATAGADPGLTTASKPASAGAKRSLVFSYEGKEQPVKFYEGTPPQNILRLALKLFALDVPIDDVGCLDEDDDPIVFEPSCMPNGCRVFLRLGIETADEKRPSRHSCDDATPLGLLAIIDNEVPYKDALMACTEKELKAIFDDNKAIFDDSRHSSFRAMVDTALLKLSESCFYEALNTLLRDYEAKVRQAEKPSWAVDVKSGDCIVVSLQANDDRNCRFVKWTWSRDRDCLAAWIIDQGTGNWDVFAVDQVIKCVRCRVKMEPSAAPSDAIDLLNSGRRVTDEDVFHILEHFPFQLSSRQIGCDKFRALSLGLLWVRNHADVSANGSLHPALTQVLNRWARQQLPDDFHYTTLYVTKDFPPEARHRDKKNVGCAAARSLGKFKGGQLRHWPEDDKVRALDDDLGEPTTYDGSKFEVMDLGKAHEVAPYSGRRYGFICFTPRASPSSQQREKLEALGFPILAVPRKRNARTEAEAAGTVKRRRKALKDGDVAVEPPPHPAQASSSPSSWKGFFPGPMPWKEAWPKLEEQGWRVEHRFQGHLRPYYFPPGIKMGEGRNRRDYFDSKKTVLRYVCKDSEELN
mmetsp:Transcript_38062/g.83001  ORF Transcript_38062/g.83001 Transcript_38062/m.83001 type:complete len:580 (+) Transcript_38062:82-1821(+)